MKKQTKETKQTKKAKASIKPKLTKVKVIEPIAQEAEEPIELKEAQEPTELIELKEAQEPTVPTEPKEPKEISNLNGLVRIVEGVLFAASLPLSVDAIIKFFPEEERPKADAVRKALVQLRAHYEERGIKLVEVASGYRFQVADEVTPYIAQSLEEKPARFSRALLETLALIAYRQPITRGEIEDIRGVVVSTNIIKTLDELNWIRVVGHKEVPGKPALFATTKSFLDYFGLKSLEDLPPLAELQEFEMSSPPTGDPQLADPQLELDVSLEQDPAPLETKNEEDEDSNEGAAQAQEGPPVPSEISCESEQEDEDEDYDDEMNELHEEFSDDTVA